MATIKCDVCGSTEIKKTGNDLYTCQTCGIQYSKEEIKKLYINDEAKSPNDNVAEFKTDENKTVMVDNSLNYNQAKSEAISNHKMNKNTLSNNILDEPNNKISLKRIFKILIPIIPTTIIFIFVISLIVIPAIKYSKATDYLEQKKYDDAIALYEELDDYKDSKDLISEAYYQKARKLNCNDEKLEAALIFGKIHKYKDSWERRCKIIPNPTISASNFLTAGVKNDGSVIVTKCDNEYILNHGQFEVDDWDDIISVAAGYDHTVGLKENGTVVAVGNNKNGQCNVKDWKDIIAISAGNAHTLGLRSDGTVVAVGLNTYEECNVSDWKNVVSIFAIDDQSFGLLSNGTMISTSESVVSGWNDLVSIAKYGTFTIGLKSDGNVISNKPESQRLLSEYCGQCDITDWTNIVAITVGNQTVGLKSNGNVVITKYTGKNIKHCWDVNGWNNIVYITSGGGQLIGLKSNGSIVETEDIYDFSEIYDWNREDVKNWENIRLPTQ